MIENKQQINEQPQLLEQAILTANIEPVKDNGVL
jgi:hypothetical protein